jgi:Mg-chelatase subunit ChlD
MSLEARVATHQAAYAAGSAATVYALVSLAPGAVKGRLPLDLRLVLDHSGSMGCAAGKKGRQTKLALLKEAVCAMISRLEVGDRVTVISFDDTARVVFQQSIRASRDMHAAQKAVQGIREGGGTSVLAGLEAAIAEPPCPGHLARLVLVTDGETSHGEEPACERVAFDARGAATWLVYGIGVDYNDRFLDTLARANGGRYEHLSDMAAAAALFATEVAVMGDVALTDLVVNVEPMPGVAIAKADRIVPVTEAVPVALPDFLSVALGDVDRARGQKLLLQLTVVPQGPGDRVLAKVSCGYHVPVKKRLNQTLTLEVTARFGAGAGATDLEVLRTIQLAGATRLQTLGMAELAGGDGGLGARTLASSAAIFDGLGLSGVGDQLRTLTSAYRAGPTLGADAEDVRRTLTTMSQKAWALGGDEDVP